MDDPRVAELSSIASTLLDGLRERPPDPNALLFLLRHLATTDREDVREMLGEALTAALASHLDEPSIVGRAAWLSLFHDAAALSDDERLLEATVSLVASLKREWGSASSVADAACAVDACLRAADLDPGGGGALIASAIDELERIVGRSYAPGEGIGDYVDHVRAAAALVTAFELTGRLPYAMLAEELMQSVRRGAPPDGLVGVACEAVRVFCRLAALHDNPDYRAAAVIAPNADYRADATRILSSLAPSAVDADAASYGLALSELLLLTIESPDSYGH